METAHAQTPTLWPWACMGGVHVEAGGPSCLLGAGGGPPSGVSGPPADPLGASELGAEPPLLGGFAGVGGPLEGGAGGLWGPPGKPCKLRGFG